MIADAITSARKETIAVRPARRSSERMERSALAPSTIRVGSFGDGYDLVADRRPRRLPPAFRGRTGPRIAAIEPHCQSRVRPETS